MGNNLWLKELAAQVRQVAQDVQEIAQSGQYPVVTLLRGYDLLERLGNWEDVLFNVEQAGENCGEEGEIGKASAEQPVGKKSAEVEDFYGALEEYREMYLSYGERLYVVMDPEQIKMKAAAFMGPWKRRHNEALEELQRATELWEMAKVAHKAQMEGGFFEKWKTLRQVRKMAGFRLEKGRTGNFVTRTFDLMNEARSRAREAELKLYEHNVEYKCTPDSYLRIFEVIAKIEQKKK